MEAGFSDLERFIHAETEIPPLLKCGMIHYQFETLHPFLDGNGRLGRLLVVFFLVSEGHLPTPLLYLSPYLERHRDRYYNLLQGVREKGDLEAWLQFFLAGVREQAADAVARSERLTDIREDYRRRLTSTRSRAHQILGLLDRNPIISARDVMEHVRVTNQGALGLLGQLERAGIVWSMPGRARPRLWMAGELMAALAA
jgi:Fic family protein